MRESQLGTRLVVVSNRRPFTIKRGPEGPLVEKSAGGLVAAVYPLFESVGGTWVAWDGAGRSLWTGPAYRKFWEQEQEGHSPLFRSYIDSEIFPKARS